MRSPVHARSATLLLATSIALASCRGEPSTIRTDPAGHAPPMASSEASQVSAAGSDAASAAEAPQTFRKRKRTKPKSAIVKKGSGDDLSSYDVSLNPLDAASRALFAREDDTCFYETPGMPIPAGSDPPMGFRNTVRHDADCSEAMDDPAWDGCAPGEITQSSSTGRCVCTEIAAVMVVVTPWAIDCPKKK